MKTRIRDYLDLVRLPNLFTAAGDSIAGFLYAGGSPADFKSWLWLGAASMLLYAGGVALNDVCDVATDLRERPSRPIPSGRISHATALRISIVLLAAAVAIAMTLSLRCAIIALGIVLCIVLYDAALKQAPLSPIFMGACRGLNLLLGMALVNPLATETWAKPVALMTIYVTSLTIFARREAGSSSPIQLGIGAAGVSLSVAALLFLDRQASANMAVFSVIAILSLTIWLGYNGVRATFSPKPLFVQRAVKRFVIGIALFDACLVLTRGMPVASVCIASLSIPAFLLARRLRVT
ncbi:MAG: UbiA family prenyltransferase [Planctomycetes bacterium]|nr:UbiA family prenyltransferase [Planctomycetota bacterium]MBI3835785.1 UbiA family prenyltransferase [Planctomycetota bacterium]